MIDEQGINGQENVIKKIKCDQENDGPQLEIIK